MANFILVVDPDLERRAGFLSAASARVALAEGLEGAQCSAGDFGCLWAAEARAPVGRAVDEEGAAVLWGEPIQPGSAERIGAERLRTLWTKSDERPPDAFDGLYATAVYQSGRGLRVGADLLGLFPVYYFGTEEVILVGSSPELFRYHPAFVGKLNPTGLVGMLLLGHLFDGQSLWQGVRRLGPGCLLEWQPGRPPRETAQYRLPICTKYLDFPFRAHVDIVQEAVDEAMKRHVLDGRPYGLMLSGGQDSRLLGGYLRERGLEVSGLSLGAPTDLEMYCANAVARELKIKQLRTDLDLGAFPAAAERAARWEHLAGGMNSVFDWSVLPFLRRLPLHVAMGYVFDSIIVGQVIFGYQETPRTYGFPNLVAKMNTWGVPQETLRRLLRPELADLPDERLQRMKAIYDGYSDLPFQKVWGFCLHHRARFHVGSSIWRLSMGSYPLLPALDRRIIAEVAGGMPTASLAKRRLESQLIIQRFPRLAALPLDRNSYNIEPLQPRLRWLLGQNLKRRLGSLDRWLPKGKAAEEVERRYYYRIFDFSNAGWAAVRRAAEPHRERLQEVFDPKVLDAYLPPPEVPIPMEQPIAEASGRKLLLGLMLWAGEHL